MKSRQWLVTFGLVALVLAVIVGWVLTRQPAQPNSAVMLTLGEQAPLVNEKPLQTARAMGKLASNPDEQRVAQQAEQFADAEVDLAFHDASRDAADHPPQAKAKFKTLFDHVNQAQVQVKSDQDIVDGLKKRLAAAPASHQAGIQEKLDVAQAQLELDQDELDNAKENLVRSGADPGSLIQHQFDEHQAAEHSGEAQQAEAASAPPIDYNAGNLIAQTSAWRAVQTKLDLLQQAKNETQSTTADLTKAQDALQKQISAEKKQHASDQAAGSSDANATVQSLHLISGDRKNLIDYGTRIQDEQQLQNAYAAWIDLIHGYRRTILHNMLQSVLWILLIALGVYLANRSIDHYLADKGTERTRLHTLEAVFHFSAQAVGVLLILLVIFGPPRQIATILGFATAGLTVALKDFIVAFVGWFVLMGKNGVRVGDWVEINGVAGEVMEINLLRTVLLETGNWTDTGHPTGRRVAFVNSYAIEGHFFNFTTSGQWLWDELQIMVPANQDPYPIIDAIQQTVAKETEKNTRAAEEEWLRVTSRYRVQAVSATPAVNLRPTTSGVEVHIRYITRANERYAMRARLNQALVKLLHGRDVNQAESVPARG